MKYTLLFLCASLVAIAGMAQTGFEIYLFDLSVKKEKISFLSPYRYELRVMFSVFQFLKLPNYRLIKCSPRRHGPHVFTAENRIGA